mgnify:CR=1 FL=1
MQQVQILAKMVVPSEFNYFTINLICFWLYHFQNHLKGSACLTEISMMPPLQPKSIC